MMSSILLRRSAALAASRAGATSALFPSIATFFASSLDVSGGVVPSIGVTEKPFGVGFQSKGFHAASGPLNFKASLVSRAEFAVEEYGDANSGRSGDEGLEVGKLGIAQEIVSALAKKGITKLFPIQKAVLEPAMQGRDMIGRARTGTGKTLAFGIPILDKIIQYNAKHGQGRNPLALVLAPTRELARQVEKEFQEAAPSLDTICVYGGTPISSQMRQLGFGVDIAVGTPGRLIDLLNRGVLNLSEVQFVVLDEADQMLQVGFQEDVEKILERLPKKRQSMMFSATMPSWIRKLSQNYLTSPVTIDLVGDSDQKLADGISLFSVVADTHGKASIIGPLITEHAKGGKCIVFTQTKRDADRLAYALARKFKCEALHGDISQSMRERTLSGFRDGHFNILVATDVAARGLDIPNVDLVIHFELPNNTEIFVHRSGRTGRAGKKGRAVLIYSQDQSRAVRMIEREVGCRFTEIPKITVEDDAHVDMFSHRGGGEFGSFGGGFRDRRMNDSGRFGSSRGSSFGRSGGYENSGSRGSGFGRSGGYENTGSRGSGFGRSGGYENSGFSRPSGRDSYGQGSRNSGPSFGGFGSSGSRSSEFPFGGSNSNSSGSGRSGGFGDFGSSGRSSGFGDFGSSGRSSGFGSSGRNSGFGDKF